MRMRMMMFAVAVIGSAFLAASPPAGAHGTEIMPGDPAQTRIEQPYGGSRSACMSNAKAQIRAQLPARSSALRSSLQQLKASDLCSTWSLTATPLDEEVALPSQQIHQGYITFSPALEIEACGPTPICGGDAWRSYFTMRWNCDGLWASGGPEHPPSVLTPANWSLPPFWDDTSTTEWVTTQAGLGIGGNHVLGRDYLSISFGLGPASVHQSYRLWINGDLDCGSNYGIVKT